MALLLLLLPLLSAAAVAYLCCGRRHTGSAAAVLHRRGPRQAGPTGPPRDIVSAGPGGGRGAVGPAITSLLASLRSGLRGCAALGCASSSMWLTR